MKRSFLPLVFLAVSALPAIAGTPIRVVSIMPSFFAILPGDQKSTLGDRVKAFKETVVYPNVDLYDRGMFTLDDPHIAWYLGGIAKDVPKFRELTTSLEHTLPRYEAAFESAFPKFDPSTVQIYLMPSMNTFDGMTTDLKDIHALLIGVDTLASEKPNLGVFVDHELFHIYHHVINPSFFATSSENDLYRYGLYRQLWAEGLATYVSQQLNPSASNADALASTALANLSESGTRQLACLAHDNMDSKESRYSSLLFDADAHPDNLPSRGGYYIGYLVAKQLNRRQSLSDLADLRGDNLRTLVGNALATFVAKTESR